jgi:hypothetical protein
MKKTRSFNYIAFFIYISIAAFLTGFVYVQLMKDFKKNNVNIPASSNKNIEGFITIPKINAIYRPMIRNARLSINKTVNSFTNKVDNYLRKNNWLA